MAAEVVDPRVRTYVLPKKVVWTNDSARVLRPDALLKVVHGQVPDKQWISSPQCCTLVNNQNPGSIVLDFGRELHGGLQIGCSPSKDAKDGKMRLRVRFGESVGEVMAELGEKHTTNHHAIRDGIITVPWMGSIEIGNTGFRFVRLDLMTPGRVDLEFVRAISVMRPMQQQGSFTCSDARLNQIWETARRTVHLCCQDFLWDGIKRDRLVWMGDMHPEARTLLAVYGATDVLRDSLKYIIATTPPGKWMNDMSNYTLWFIRVMKEWTDWTGEASFAQKHKSYLLDTIRTILAGIAPDGKSALSGRPFLDWPTEHNKGAARAGTQALHALTLDDAAQLAALLEDPKLAAACREGAARLRTVRPDPVGAKSAAALLVLGGFGDPAAFYRDVLSKNGHAGVSTFYGYYVLEAMSFAGENQRALDTVRDYWGGMLDMGATSFWEDFNLAWTNNATRIDEMPVVGKKDIHGDFGEFCYRGYRHSLCHGWASGPAAWCIHHVLGLRFAEPGGRLITVTPFLGDLAWAEGSIATPYGPVFVRHEKQPDGTIKTEIKKPDEIKIKQ